MAQKHKKQGLNDAENEFICAERGILLRGIPPALVVNNKIQIEHFICKICSNVIWKPVACSQPHCFANFCEYCVSNCFPSSNKQDSQQICGSCPNCQKPFHKTSIPLVNNLLSQLQIACYFHKDGCQQNIPYDSYLKHCLKCDFRRVQCEGCKIGYLLKEIKQHRGLCSDIVVQCPKCLLELPQVRFKEYHTEIKCLETQLNSKTTCVVKLEKKVEYLRERLNQYGNLMEKIIKGENMQLPYQLYSSFPMSFQFVGSEVRVSRASWNSRKQKYDFLHFYITSSIKTESPVGYHWKLLIKVLKGNLLIGICSSLMANSVDFVINRFGEIKKKQSAQNKYKLITKGNLTFSEGNVISFKYLPLRQTLKIENETRKVQCTLESKQIMELGDNLYSFYSLDTANDAIKFI